MPCVLIVDDEADLTMLVAFNTTQAGFKTLVAHDGASALQLVRAHSPDLVILDVMLPDISGVELCRALRHEADTAELPILMLTAKDEEADRIEGFAAGADDYLGKPFSVRELIWRIKALLKRRTQREALPAKLTVGLLSLELSEHRGFVDGREIALTALEYRLLQYLMERQGRVQTRLRLLQDVWGVSAAVETRTVDTHVMRLRDRLGPARGQLETVRGVGYRLSADPGADVT